MMVSEKGGCVGGEGPPAVSEVWSRERRIKIIMGIVLRRFFRSYFGVFLRATDCTCFWHHWACFIEG